MYKMTNESPVAQSVLTILAVVAALLATSGVDAYHQCVKVAYPLLCKGQPYDGNAVLMMIERDSLGFIDVDDFMGIQVYNGSATLEARPVHWKRRDAKSAEEGIHIMDVETIDAMNDATTTTTASAALGGNGTTAIPRGSNTTTAADTTPTTSTAASTSTATGATTKLGATNNNSSSEPFCEDELGSIEPVLYVRHSCGANSSAKSKEEFCVRLVVPDTDIYADGDSNSSLLQLDLSDKNNFIDFDSCKEEFNYYAPQH